MNDSQQAFDYNSGDANDENQDVHERLADEAEVGERFTLAEGREYIRQRRAERYTTRQQEDASA